MGVFGFVAIRIGAARLRALQITSVSLCWSTAAPSNQTKSIDYAGEVCRRRRLITSVPLAKRVSTHVAIAALTMLLCTVTEPVKAADFSEILTEDRIARSLGVMPISEFGESFDYQNGQFGLAQDDIVLTGTGPEIRIGRRFNYVFRFPSGVTSQTLDWVSTGTAADWSLELPRLSVRLPLAQYAQGQMPVGAVLTPRAQWNVVGSNPMARCTNFANLPGIPARGNDMSWVIPGSEWWTGLSMMIPGQSPQTVLARDPAATALPRHLVTNQNWVFTCLPSLKNGEAGEGFLAISPSGTKYWFDWLTFSDYDWINTYSNGVNVLLRSIEASMLVTRIEDANGNWVNYTYDDRYLTGISASDGREVALDWTSYDWGNSLIVSGQGPFRFVKRITVQPQSEKPQIWQYVYELESGGWYWRRDAHLRKVIRPDNSEWTFNLDAMVKGCYGVGSDGELDFPCGAGEGGKNFDSSITSPSGATATYSFLLNFARRYIAPGGFHDFRYDNQLNHIFALKQKRVVGTGVDQSWTYSFVPGHNVPSDQSPWPWVTATVVNPDQTTMRYTVNNIYRDRLEGRVSKLEIIDASGSLMRELSYDYASQSQSPYPAKVGSSLQAHAGTAGIETYIPLLARTINQQGVTYTSQVGSFDVFARPTSEAKTNSLGYAKTHATTYHDNVSKWVIGQVATVTCMTAIPESTSCNGNDQISKTEYDANAMPWKTYSFGKLQQTLTYDTASAATTGQRGTLKSVTDGNNNVITLNNWKRGIPQKVTYPGTTDQPTPVSRSAVVNDNGWIDSVVDENGYRTCYTYDSMGRLASIAYPSEAPPLSDGGRVDYCDDGELFWKKTTISFTNVGTSEAYEVPAGHWRQTILSGNNRKIAIYDALWRPIVEQAVDLGNVGGTISVVVKRYDSSGRPAFQSYPVRDPGNYADPNLKGVKTEYDALDRVTAVRQDAEGGAVLSTTTVYTANRLKTEVTNPNNKTTYTWYMAYDQPHYDWPIQTYHPESVATNIGRDALGKPLTVTRRSLVDNTISATRSYAYNPYHELCRTVEPETGTTWMGYDGAGNLAWSAAGLPAVSETTPCANGTTPDIVARKVTRTYDARNRLKTLRFPDTRGNQDWFYTPDGLPSKVVTVNVPGAVHPENHYTYNKRRLPVTELQALPEWYTSSLSYEYDGYAHLKKLYYPSTQSVEFFPNALGQATLVKGGTGHIFASNVTYHPNGAIAGFTYGNGPNGNGITHTMTQNERLLPRFVADAGVFDLDYRYDGNGNVDTVFDILRGAGGNRSMDYDGLDRLTHVGFAQLGGNHHMHFTYDALDNLKTWKHPAADGTTMVRDHLYCYNSKNQLEFIRSGATTCSNGAAAEHFQYDVQGNVEIHDVGFDFDYGNRLREVIDKERYRYDAHGRRILAVDIATGTGTIFSQYGGNGQLLYQKNERTGQNKEIDHIYLGGSLIAQREASLDTGAASVKYIHTDALGSPVAATNQSGGIVENIVDYEPYGRQLDTAATIGKDRPGYTGHVRDVATGLNYMQQRYYDPAIGRFLSVDPITANSGTGANFNRYWYANNNPYRFTDPDGRQTIPLENRTGTDDPRINNEVMGAQGDLAFTLITGFDVTEVAPVGSGAVQSGITPFELGAASSLRSLPARLATKGTGTVWDSIKATQGVWPGTSIPRSFELTAGSTRVWVHGNATEHLAEYATSMANRGVSMDLVRLGTQQQLWSLQLAIRTATANGMTYNRLMTVGGWELKFAAPRAEGQLPALIHALPAP